MRKRIIVSLLAAIALAVGASSAGAGSNPTGVRLGGLFFGGTQAIQADTPFYVKHGFVIVDGDATPAEIQQSNVSLTVDGVKQNGTVIQEFSNTKPPVLTQKWYLFNFKNGLPVGSYTFVLSFTFKGEVVGTFTTTIVALASCENGTTNGLLCAPPPPPA